MPAFSALDLGANEARGSRAELRRALRGGTGSSADQRADATPIDQQAMRAGLPDAGGTLRKWASYFGQRTATMRPNSSNSTEPVRTGRGVGAERVCALRHWRGPG